MKLLLAKITSFLLCDSGATAIEYGLLTGGIALAIVTAVFSVGSDLRNVFESLGSSMANVASNVQGSTG